MARFLDTPKSAQVGSNIKHSKAFKDQLARDLAPWLKARAKAQRALLRTRNSLISKAAAKQAAAIIRNGRSEFDQAFLDAKGDRDRIARAKDKTRRSINRALSKRVPGYNQYRAAQKAYVKDLRASRTMAAAGPLHQELDVNLGDLPLSENYDYQEFAAPYELFGTEMWGDWPGRIDDSFTAPDSGLVVQNIQFEHHYDAWSGPLHYIPPVWAYAVSVVGINYVVPRTGRLNCAAVLQNLHNRITSWVTNDYGVSYADTRADHGIFIRVVRSGEWTGFWRTLVKAGLTSFGSELTYTFSDIQNTTPYTMSFTSSDVFLKGERIQILVGSGIMYDSVVDDMTMHVDSVLMWQLKMLRVGMQD